MSKTGQGNVINKWWKGYRIISKTIFIPIRKSCKKVFKIMHIKKVKQQTCLSSYTLQNIFIFTPAKTSDLLLNVPKDISLIN